MLCSRNKSSIIVGTIKLPKISLLKFAAAPLALLEVGHMQLRGLFYKMFDPDTMLVNKFCVKSISSPARK